MKNSRTYPRFELCNWVDIDGSLYEIIGIEQPQGEYLLREPGSHLAHREHWHIIDKYPLAILTPEFAKAIKDVEESKARYRKIAKSGATHHTHLNQPITTKDKENKMSKIKFREVNGQLFKLTEVAEGKKVLSEQLSIVQESLCQIRWDWSDPRGWLEFANEALDTIRKEFPELMIKECSDFEMEG